MKTCLDGRSSLRFIQRLYSRLRVFLFWARSAADVGYSRWAFRMAVSLDGFSGRHGTQGLEAINLELNPYFSIVLIRIRRAASSCGAIILRVLRRHLFRLPLYICRCFSNFQSSRVPSLSQHRSTYPCAWDRGPVTWQARPASHGLHPHRALCVVPAAVGPMCTPIGPRKST